MEELGRPNGSRSGNHGICDMDIYAAETAGVAFREIFANDTTLLVDAPRLLVTDTVVGTCPIPDRLGDACKASQCISTPSLLDY